MSYNYLKIINSFIQLVFQEYMIVCFY